MFVKHTNYSQLYLVQSRALLQTQSKNKVKNNKKYVDTMFFFVGVLTVSEFPVYLLGSIPHQGQKDRSVSEARTGSCSQAMLGILHTGH